MINEKVDAAIKAVCPIDGVSIGREDDKTTWRIDFKVEATDEQRAAAKAALQSFDIAAVVAAEKFSVVEGALQDAMDAAARSRGYDDLRSAITYRGSSNPTWAHEADVFFAWRDAVWEKAISVLQDVQAGKAKMPTPDEALAMMPALVF